MTIYATPAQLANYIAGRELDDETEPLPAPPATAGVLLRRASSLVGEAIKAALYRVDANGYPLNPAYRTALAEATAAQAAAWSENGIDPTKGRAGAKAAIASKSLGGASVAYASYAADAEARSDLASGDVLISEAIRVLDAAGLRSSSVQSNRGGVDVFPQAYPFDRFSGRYIGPGDSLA